jgi:outer membrane protein assembly factor BamB
MLSRGGNVHNNRFASTNRKILSSSIRSLTVKCQHPFPGGVSATPTIVQGVAYFPTWNGSLLAVDCSTCHVQWHVNVTQVINDFAPVPANESTPAYIFSQASRTSPQVDLLSGVLYFGTLTHALIGEWRPFSSFTTLPVAIGSLVLTTGHESRR